MDAIFDSIVKNSKALLLKASDLSPSYQSAMKRAHENFVTTGIPTKKDEDWIYTQITPHLSPRFFEQKETIVHDLPSEVLDKRGMIIFNNGYFNKFQSILPEGVELDALVPEEEFFDSFDSLNFAGCLSPLSLKIKKNTQIDFPLSIIHLVDDVGVNKIVSPRLKITAEENTKLCLIEIFQSTNKALFQYTTNAVTTFNLLANANIEHVKIQNEATHATHVGLTKAQVNRSAKFKSMTVDAGNLLSRHNIEVNLTAPGAETSVNGLFSLKNSEHCDIFSNIYHKTEHTFSEQLFKGILSGESHGAFTGKIVIAKDAKLCTSAQLNKNLLLSKKAHIDTRPQLLVHADDVKCTHGATIGQLSKEEEFYLESRGIPKERARKMLCLGFATDALDKIENSSMRMVAKKIVLENLDQSGLGEMTL